MHDTWQKLLEQYRPLMGRTYAANNKKYVFFGLVDAADDYYFGMCLEDGSTELWSCVGDIEGFGATLVLEAESN